MVAGVTKEGGIILAELTPEKCNLWHAATGISGESGELLDAIKKHVAYDSDLDRENVIEELGDLEFYMERLRSALFITREETLEANIEKLAKRYPGFHFSNQAAQHRADKAATNYQPLNNQP